MCPKFGADVSDMDIYGSVHDIRGICPEFPDDIASCEIAALIADKEGEDIVFFPGKDQRFFIEARRSRVKVHGEWAAFGLYRLIAA
jgi:hypothetical protein